MNNTLNTSGTIPNPYFKFDKNENKSILFNGLIVSIYLTFDRQTIPGMALYLIHNTTRIDRNTTSTQILEFF